jgi:hypothetical protein
MMYRATVTIGSVLEVGQTISDTELAEKQIDVARLVDLGALVQTDTPESTVQETDYGLREPVEDFPESNEEPGEKKKGRPKKLKD